MEGGSQKIAVSSNPPGAYCVLKSNDDIIGAVESTPATITVKKSKYDIIVECSKEGYQKNKGRNHSDYAISSVGNMVFGQFGVIGSILDNESGAGNKYDSQIVVELEKNPAFNQLAAAPQTTVNPPQTVQYIYQIPLAYVSAVPLQAKLVEPQQIVAMNSDALIADSERKPPFNIDY